MYARIGLRNPGPQPTHTEIGALRARFRALGPMTLNNTLVLRLEPPDSIPLPTVPSLH